MDSFLDLTSGFFVGLFNVVSEILALYNPEFLKLGVIFSIPGILALQLILIPFSWYLAYKKGIRKVAFVFYTLLYFIPYVGIIALCRLLSLTDADVLNRLNKLEEDKK